MPKKETIAEDVSYGKRKVVLTLTAKEISDIVRETIFDIPFSCNGVFFSPDQTMTFTWEVE